MQWSEVTKTPPRRQLRQFAVLCLVFFGGMTAWRAWRGHLGTGSEIVGVIGVATGMVGVIAPAAIRWIYTGWMIAVFPIGWAVSRVILAALYFLVFTPVAVVFRMMGRDALRLKRPPGQSYWVDKTTVAEGSAYFRQF